MRSVHKFTATFTEDAVKTGTPFKAGAGGSAPDFRLPWNLVFHCKPVVADLTGTIAFDAKLQMAPSETGPWEDVTLGASATITVGGEDSELLQLAGTTVLHRWLRASMEAAITTADYQDGSVFSFEIMAA